MDVKLPDSRCIANGADANDRTLLLLAASARWLAQSCSIAQIPCIAIDLFGDWDTCQLAESAIRVDSFGDAVSLAKRIRPGRILFGGGFESHPKIARKLREIAPLINVRPQAVRACRNPAVWCKKLRANGVAVPRWQRHIDSLAHKSRWLIKCIESAGGGGVSAAVSETSRPRSKSVFAQEFIDGTPSSAIFLADRVGCNCLGFFRQLVGLPELGAKPFQYCGAVGPIPLASAQQSQLRQIASVLFKSLGVRGVVGVDLIERDGELVPIEINPRLTATCELWERRFGTSLVQLHCQTFGQDETRADTRLEIGVQDYLTVLSTDNLPVLGKAIYFWRSEKPFVMNENRFSKFRKWRADRLLADIPREKTKVPNGRPIATLFTEGRDVNDAVDKLICGWDALVSF